MDVTDIEAGADFVNVIQRAVVSCDALLAVLGREWLTCEDRNGRRRLDDPSDFIRLEIGTALARNVRVIPVLVEGAVMPSASELPPDLEGLTRRQAVELRDSRWIDDIESLTTALDRLVDPAIRGTDGRAPAESRPQRSRILAAAGAALVAVIAAAVWLVPRIEWMSSAPATQTASSTPAIENRRTVILPNAERPAPDAQRPPPNAAPKTPATTRVSPERGVRADLVPARPGPAAVASGGAGRPREVVPDRADPRSTAGSVVIYYRTDADQQTAEDLATELRRSVPDPRYSFRTIKTTRSADGEVLYNPNPPGDRTLAVTLSQSAGPWLSRRYSRQVAFTPAADSRVVSTSVILVMPGNAAAPAIPVVNPVVTIAFSRTNDQQLAEGLAAFLRTRKDQKYLVRTIRAKPGRAIEGQIEYDNEGMAQAAQDLARDAGPWISRAYGRQVALKPTLTGKIGASSLHLWLPGR